MSQRLSLSKLKLFGASEALSPPWCHPPHSPPLRVDGGLDAASARKDVMTVTSIIGRRHVYHQCGSGGDCLWTFTFLAVPELQTERIHGPNLRHGPSIWDDH